MDDLVEERRPETFFAVRELLEYRVVVLPFLEINLELLRVVSWIAMLRA